ncbi:uncharacterized protein pou2af1 [Hippocampus comes]|uniref:uncharacterized protein pou2af1 n=1 Tax=Hippocampus comes TaxID=109280 RepID=UPI00094F2BFF|nr:PREDICTED: POU domain class 2-associating factor 1 [Hippocampus comes]
MHLDKSHPAAPSRSRPYQGVRVKDSVKELLRRKRSAELLSTKTTAHAPVTFSKMGSSHPAAPSRSRPYQGVRVKDSVKELLRRKRSAELLSTKTTAHAPRNALPLITDYFLSFQTIPVGATTCSLPQMDLPDLGCAYLPWTHPLTTLSTVISGVQFASGSTPVSGSSFVHTPLSKSLTNQDIASQHQILEPLQYSDQTNPKLHNEVLDEDQEVELETPNLLDKILEDQGKGEDSGGKVSYSNSFYLPSAF